jgi:hypothetical protein
MGECGAVVRLRWWWEWGSAFANARQERELGAKTHETERDGSISGAPCEMEVEGDGGRWWDEVDKVRVAVGLCVRKREAREGAGVQIRRNRA